MDLHDPQKREKKKRQLGEYTAIFTSRLDKNEYLFAFIIDRLSFLSVSCFWFLVSFYGCHSLIFIFFWWVYMIILSDKYWVNQAIDVTKVVRIFSGLLRRMWKKKFLSFKKAP